MITAKPSSQGMSITSTLDDNTPDLVSEELLDEVDYEGELVNESQFIFLPMITR